MSTIRTFGAVAIGAALIASVSNHTDNTPAPAPVQEQGPSTAGYDQPRPIPDPSEFDAETVERTDVPGEYSAICEDGAVVNYWPPTEQAWRHAVDNCQLMGDFTEQLGDELDRRGAGEWR
ncbi:hypothetical protein [Saccharopolyspora sp. NPDC002686]|uniref:hypothetical protein n=1 Tax=Saccharopolyspora sp. NPDC002686 TaxID=3154541 RepID=UPI00331DD73B